MIRIITRTILFSSAAFLGMTQTVNAGAENITIEAGKKTLIYQFAVYSSNCGNAAYPSFKAKKTKNGASLTSSRGSFIANNGRCKGKSIRSTNIYYQPKTGFRGKDTARVSLGYPVDVDSPWGTQYKTLRFNITVK